MKKRKQKKISPIFLTPNVQFPLWYCTGNKSLEMQFDLEKNPLSSLWFNESVYFRALETNCIAALTWNNVGNWSLAVRLWMNSSCRARSRAASRSFASRRCCVFSSHNSFRFGKLPIATAGWLAGCCFYSRSFTILLSDLRVCRRSFWFVVFFFSFSSASFATESLFSAFFNTFFRRTKFSFRFGFSSCAYVTFFIFAVLTIRLSAQMLYFNRFIFFFRFFPSSILANNQRWLANRR